MFVIAIYQRYRRTRQMDGQTTFS